MVVRKVLTALLAAVLGGALLVIAPVVASAGTARGVRCEGTTVVAVAHQDDDLLFINPTIESDFRAGRCIRVIYLTAGEAGEVNSSGYYQFRELGVQQAYATLAGVPMSATKPTPWRSSDLTVNGRKLHSVRLTTGAGRPDIQLLFLRMPDGQPDGAGTATFGNQSLLKLWQGTIKSISAIDGSTSYTSAALTSTLTALIERFRGTTVRTLDYMNTQLGYSEDLTGGVDHSDHDVTARYMRIATLAAQQRMRHLALAAYEGYGISTRPANLPASVIARKTAIFQNYDIHDDKDGNGCSAKIYCAPTKELAADYANWVQRHYVRPLPAPQAGTIVSWIGDTAKSYTNANLCLTSSASGTISTSHCGATGQQWRLRHGVLHAGTASGQCVGTYGTSVTLGRCGDHAARWQLTRLGQLHTTRGCLTQDDMLSLKPKLHLAACSAVNPGQRWFIGTSVG